MAKPRTLSWTNALRVIAEHQSPYFLAMLVNGVKCGGDRRFTNLGWNGVLAVAPNGDVIGAGHAWKTSFSDMAAVQPSIPARSRALVVIA